MWRGGMQGTDAWREMGGEEKRGLNILLFYQTPHTCLSIWASQSSHSSSSAARAIVRLNPCCSLMVLKRADNKHSSKWNQQHVVFIKTFSKGINLPHLHHNMGSSSSCTLFFLHELDRLKWEGGCETRGVAEGRRGLWELEEVTVREISEWKAQHGCSSCVQLQHAVLHPSDPSQDPEVKVSEPHLLLDVFHFNSIK